MATEGLNVWMALLMMLNAELGPGPITDLKASWDAPVSSMSIVWWGVVPALNDSAGCVQGRARTVAKWDSVTYHYKVWGLPIPYPWVLEDSSRYARRDTLRREYPTWIDKYYISEHWLSRRSGSPTEYVDRCKKQQLLLRPKLR